MILLYDNRKPISLDQRLHIACINNTPIGEHSVELNQKWYEDMKSPHPEVELGGLFESFFLKDSIYMKEYLQSLTKTKWPPNTALYLSIFDSVVQQMNARYNSQT